MTVVDYDHVHVLHHNNVYHVILFWRKPNSMRQHSNIPKIHVHNDVSRAPQCLSCNATTIPTAAQHRAAILSAPGPQHKVWAFLAQRIKRKYCVALEMWLSPATPGRRHQSSIIVLPLLHTHTHTQNSHHC